MNDYSWLMSHWGHGLTVTKTFPKWGLVGYQLICKECFVILLEYVETVERDRQQGPPKIPGTA